MGATRLLFKKSKESEKQVDGLSMVGFVEILLYLVHLGTFDSKRRRMRCYEKEFRKEGGQKNTFLVYSSKMTWLSHALIFIK
jgi:hypothetical protein